MGAQCQVIENINLQCKAATENIRACMISIDLAKSG